MEILISIIGYLVGSISSSIIICKLYKLPDPRKQGSKNAGATNVARFADKKIAILVLLGDMLKGLLIVIIAKLLQLSPIAISLGAFAVVIGHIFPIFFNFKGGKGIATMLGVLIGLSPISALLILLIWICIALITKYSSLASIISSISMPIVAIFMMPEYLLLCFTLAVLLTAMHHQNIRRLIAGNESQIGKTKL